MEVNLEKYKITRQNYINMKKRLTRDMKFYNFILIMGSLYLIILGITDLSFKGLLNSKLLGYISLVQSIILFVISLIIRPDDTKDKINNLEKGILELNNIITDTETEVKNKEKRKKDIDAERDEDTENEKKLIKELEKRYSKLMEEMITREDIDYYYTAKYFVLNKKSWEEKELKNNSYIFQMKNSRSLQMYLYSFWLEWRYYLTIFCLVFISVILIIY